MSINKDQQQLVQEELTSVLEGKTPTMNDFQNLPLFEASMAEVQRIRSTVPVGIPHGTVGPVEIEGYHIPKGTMILPLLWAVHMDEKTWEDPEIFKLHRFIDENGRFFKSENFIPFQAGTILFIGNI